MSCCSNPDITSTTYTDECNTCGATWGYLYPAREEYQESVSSLCDLCDIEYFLCDCC